MSMSHFVLICLGCFLGTATAKMVTGAIEEMWELGYKKAAIFFSIFSLSVAIVIMFAYSWRF